MECGGLDLNAVGALYWCCTDEVGLLNRAERLGTDLGDHSLFVKFRTATSFNHYRLPEFYILRKEVLICDT